MASRTASSFVNQCGNMTECTSNHCCHATWPVDDHLHNPCRMTCGSRHHDIPQPSTYCPCSVCAYITSPSTCCYLASNFHVSCANESRHFPNCGDVRRPCSSHHHTSLTPVVHSHMSIQHLCQRAVATAETTIPTPVHPIFEPGHHHGCGTCRDTSSHNDIAYVQHIHHPNYEPCNTCNYERAEHARNLYTNVHQHRMHRRQCRSHHYTQAPLPETSWYAHPQHCTPYTYLTLPVPVYAGYPFPAAPGLLTRSTLTPIPSLSVQVEFHDATSLATQDSYDIEGLNKDEIESLPTYRLKKDKKIDKHCVICLSNYCEGDTLKSLPCCHEYHSDCVDKWLETNGTCPICRASVIGNDQSEIESI